MHERRAVRGFALHQVASQASILNKDTLFYSSLSPGLG